MFKIRCHVVLQFLPLELPIKILTKHVYLFTDSLSNSFMHVYMYMYMYMYVHLTRPPFALRRSCSVLVVPAPDTFRQAAQLSTSVWLQLDPVATLPSLDDVTTSYDNTQTPQRAPLVRQLSTTQQRHITEHVVAVTTANCNRVRFTVLRLLLSMFFYYRGEGRPSSVRLTLFMTVDHGTFCSYVRQSTSRYIDMFHFYLSIRVQFFGRLHFQLL